MAAHASDSPTAKLWCVYIVQCADGTLRTGGVRKAGINRFHHTLSLPVKLLPSPCKAVVLSTQQFVSIKRPQEMTTGGWNDAWAEVASFRCGHEAVEVDGGGFPIG